MTHATNSDSFTVFRRGERAGLSGKGIYFSPDGVGIWGKNIMRSFLNVRNPLTKENAPREVNNGGMSAVVPDVFEQFPQFDGGCDDITFSLTVNLASALKRIDAVGNH